ncbi:hypothetical protein EGW08_023541 [Elysia chlorotica]|uniref:Uncharacterized protein n=1 Tax=Elysia chlorotica TaxID=188477 RepID=A0A3S1AUK6_ELYCH|nr:hypothetical protein EGW08_023541 [Elysia chlorotica]
MFPFCFPSDTSVSQTLDLGGKRNMDFLGYTSPRSYLDAYHDPGQGEVIPVGESSENPGWPTVVDSRIPFTTYLQNLTFTLSRAAAKGVNSNLPNDRVAVPVPAVSNSTHNPRACVGLGRDSSGEVASVPRSYNSGSQAEPDSSCCDEESCSDVKEQCHDNADGDGDVGNETEDLDTSTEVIKAEILYPAEPVSEIPIMFDDSTYSTGKRGRELQDSILCSFNAVFPIVNLPVIFSKHEPTLPFPAPPTISPTERQYRKAPPAPR